MQSRVDGQLLLDPTEAEERKQDASYMLAVMPSLTSVSSLSSSFDPELRYRVICWDALHLLFHFWGFKAKQKAYHTEVDANG